MLPDARALFSPDPADALRWLRCRPRVETPERALALAVMTQAVIDLRRAPRGQTTGKERHLYRNTVAWFQNDDARWPHSFAALCALFDWSPSAVRRRLLGPVPDPEPERALRLVRRR
jgi:hypothetical protein